MVKRSKFNLITKRHHRIVTKLQCNHVLQGRFSEEIGNHKFPYRNSRICLMLLLAFWLTLLGMIILIPYCHVNWIRSSNGEIAIILSPAKRAPAKIIPLFFVPNVYLFIYWFLLFKSAVRPAAHSLVTVQCVWFYVFCMFIWIQLEKRIFNLFRSL